VPLTATKLLSVKEVADHLGISRRKVYELVHKGELSSLAIGRGRRISPAALAEFIAKPAEIVSAAPASTPYKQGPSLNRSSTPAASTTDGKQVRKREPKTKKPIDLSAKPLPPNSPDLQITDQEWEKMCSRLLEHGWPQDVVDQIRADRREHVDRIHVLTLDGAARYLGLSRRGVDQLIKAGKLRLFTIAPMYRDEKPTKRIPAKDVLTLAVGWL